MINVPVFKEISAEKMIEIEQTVERGETKTKKVGVSRSFNVLRDGKRHTAKALAGCLKTGI